MADRSLALLARILLYTLVIASFPVQAQLEQQYRVELLVFSNPGGATVEQWDATPELAYPRQAQFLLPAEERATATPLSAPTTAAANATESPLASPPTPASCVLLSASQQELAASAVALQRSGRYHILFHEAWTQPIASQAAAVPIIVDHSGDGGPWPALQGSIKIYQAGAFFLDTNLWLNTSGEYLPGGWRMPAPPRSPPSRAIEMTTPIEPPLQGAQGASPMQNGALPEHAELPPPVPAAADYPYRHAVLLKQSRKMRAGQLNYIDHPLLGVLVKITPLAAAEPSTVPAPDST